MKSTIDTIEKAIIKAFENKSGFVKVIDILQGVDLSVISNNIEHKHPTFSVDAFLKLYIYKRVKGISTFPELISNLGSEICLLGFNEVPSKRSVNEFLKEKIDKLLLEGISESILRIATQNRILLDIELVKKTVDKRRKEIARYKKELEEAIKLVKRLVYPQIDLKIHHNAKFTTRDLLDVLVHVAQNNDFCNNGSQTFKELNPGRDAPSGDTVMYHFNKFESPEEIKEVFERIFDVIFKFAKREYILLKRRRVDLAFDKHNIPYYGDKSDPYVCGGKPERGTSNFFEFLTCSIVIAGKRFTLDAVPIHPLDNMDKLLDTMLTRVMSKVHIDKIFLDRGFNNVKTINVIKKHHLRFVMPVQRWDTVKCWFDKSEDCKARIIKDFRIGTQQIFALVNLVLVDDKEGIKRAFITNLDISVPIAHYLFTWYSSRWGIETGYRMMDKDFKPRTTSKNYNIRLFYFLFSVCLYNLWVLINICISIIIHGKVLEKPIITAKMFAIVLYKIYTDPGG